MLTKRGFYGEAIPSDSGLTVVVKSHGHTTGKAADSSREEQVRGVLCLLGGLTLIVMMHSNSKLNPPMI